MRRDRIEHSYGWIFSIYHMDPDVSSILPVTPKVRSVNRIKDSDIVRLFLSSPGSSYGHRNKTIK